MKISLICATYNRSIEFEQLLDSLITQTYKNFEIIIVDQNNNGLIDDICLTYKDKLDLTHIKSKTIGLSTSRNIGLKIATGNILGFPDDDCIYYPDTLANVVSSLIRADCDIVFGRIYNRTLNKPLIRKWPDKNHSLKNINDLLCLTTSITIFCKKQGIMFDELFGVGCKFGAYEDNDWCMQYLKHQKKLVFTPTIEVFHPEGSTLNNKIKSYNYGRGWGAFFAKHMSIRILPIFIGVLIYLLLKTFSEAFLFKPIAKVRIYSIIGRIEGFYDYLKNYKFKQDWTK